MADERPLGGMDDAELFRGSLASDGGEATPPPQPEPLAPEPQPEPVPAEPQKPQAEAEGAIPSWRLREEAERARLAEERAAVLERRLREVAAHLEQQPGKQPDFFDDPNKATQAAVMSVLAPFAEETRKTMMAMGKMVATTVHGADTVNEAEQAFLAAHEDRSLDPVDYERVVQAPNRYDAVVQWHKQRATLSKVGADPEAWFEKQLEERMNDPVFQAKFVEKIQRGAAARPAETRLPPSLSRSTAVAPTKGSTGGGDLSDSSLWSFATAPAGRKQ